jgi:hypothetical protein
LTFIEEVELGEMGCGKEDLCKIQTYDVATIYSAMRARKMVGCGLGYEAAWKILEEIIIELRKKGVATPQRVMSDLKSAKVLMKIMDASEKDLGKTAPKIEQYLGSVEAYIITEAQKTFAPARIDAWLRRLEEASCDTCQICEVGEVKEKAEAKFITGVPRDKKWIRVEPLASLPAERLKQLAGETSLSFREEKDGHLTVYGSAENIKSFVKKMTEQVSKV